jgi:hypothetical protein
MHCIVLCYRPCRRRAAGEKGAYRASRPVLARSEPRAAPLGLSAVRVAMAAGRGLRRGSMQTIRRQQTSGLV